MNNNSKFDFSEEEKNTDGINKDLDQNKEAIKKGASGLLQNISLFLHNLLDFREDTDRESTIAAIKSDISIKGATAWILICSIMVASIGLNADSTAVVIGAMLISPLMGPILGIGMSIAINDIDTLKKSLINFATMIVLSLLTAYLFFKFFPAASYDTQELFGRTKPDVRDVLIAFFGGAALIIARTKKGTIASVIFGVAIATALMPPLCTAGYGLAHDWSFFTGAMYLFIINSIFIALATFLVLKILRFPMLKYANSKRRKFIARLASLVAILVMAPAIWRFIEFIKIETLEHDLADFIKYEVKPNRKLWLQEALPNWEEETITLYFNGEVPDATIADLKNELNSYEEIKDFSLIIEGNKTRSIDQISRSLDRAIEDLEQKDNIISGLQTEIKTLQEKITQLNEELEQKSIKEDIKFSSLSKDAKIRFPDLELFGYSKSLQSSNFISVDTITVIELKWKSSYNDSISTLREKEILDWLIQELNTERIKVHRN